MTHAYISHGHRTAYQGHTAQRPTFVPRIHAVAPDLIGIVAFSDTARPLLPLVQVTSPDALTAAAQLSAGGNTNVTAGLLMADSWLCRLPRHIVRRVSLIADGEPNLETALLSKAVATMREHYITVDTIFCGTSSVGADVLRSISAATVGGHFHNAGSFDALTRLVTSAAARPHRRQGATVIVIDCSSSMHEPMPEGGGTRIAAAIKACQDVALVKRVAFNRVGARQ